MANLAKRQAFLDAVQDHLGDVKTITRQDVIDICQTYDLPHPQWMTSDLSYRAGRGTYTVPTLGKVSKTVKTVKAEKVKKVRASAARLQSEVPVGQVNMAMTAAFHSAPTERPAPASAVSLIPDKARGYVPFGHFHDVRTVIASKKFYPMFITGLSGNGKTMMIEQVCAQEKRECIRVNITKQTDEDDLLGGFRLIDGKTVWQNGPVIHAMEIGAILLLDEVDLGDEKMMCLQPVLEGHAIYLKKINRVVQPAPGFNIVATANTKGKGSEDGRFVGTNVMNEAFLERFSVTLEQEYPASKVEAKILNNVLKANNVEEKDFVEKLVLWAEIVRKGFAEGAVSDIISTRRLVHICEAFVIFGQNREKAIQFCLNRFDTETKIAFMDFYKKIDDTLNPLDPNGVSEVKETSEQEVAF